ncbi:aminodeoxychorismate synthase [Astrocystis sublimbata]|nr:aminodeoxychorismate synthase [Astrocystis sublimbata]
MGRPRILFIDAYDSFSNNIVSLLTTILSADVDVLPIDPVHLDPQDGNFKNALATLVNQYHAVVCGPGPGAPHVDSDVGIMKHVWDLEAPHMAPVLGICLGFQSLVVHCGAEVKRLQQGLHGMIREIDHLVPHATKQQQQGRDIFTGVPTFKATLYHSLHADVGQDAIPAAQWRGAKWASPAPYPDLVPLAWTYEDRGGEHNVERILMGVRHRTKPFWGLQYHPESVCTEAAGHQVLVNWFQEAMAWNQATGRKPGEAGSETNVSERPETHMLAQQQAGATTIDASSAWSRDVDAKYFSMSIDIPLHVEVPDLVEILQGDEREFIVLDSASAKLRRTGLDVRGRYSIIALDVDEALKLEYRTGDRHVTARCYSPDSSRVTQNIIAKIDLGPGETIWQFLAAFWSKRRIPSGHHHHDTPEPFIGGFMGYTTYELGLEGIDVKLHSERRHDRADLSFAWVTKSIVIDHLEGTLRIQQLCASEQDSQHWLGTIADKLTRSPTWSDAIPAASNIRQNEELTPPHTPTSGTGLATKPMICVPEAAEYEAKVRACQDSIAAGDSYELCLTDQTLVTRPRSRAEGSPLQPSPSSHDRPDKPTSATPSSWHLYRTLRQRQPAPFASYLRLGGATLVSASPERFLAYSNKGVCSMRPMKGTVRKSDNVATLAAAERILHVPKEEAENLMIVDLVRHDLHAVCGPGNVTVPHLLVVEEYASVFQMISVVEGQLPGYQSPPQSHSINGNNSMSQSNGDGDVSRKEPPVTGLDVLAASLPPGSMTGAPKKRSCEILQGLEGPRARERSLYSGVVGYMDATGRGDWSVTIRSLFRWDDETVAVTGGASTIATGTPSTADTQDGTVGVGRVVEAGTEVADTMQTETWHIGAGGAVTALSTPWGERDEMVTKLKGSVGIFEDA